MNAKQHTTGVKHYQWRTMETTTTMTKAEIISQLYKSKFVHHYARQLSFAIDRPDLDDIVSELFLMLCEIDDSNLTAIFDGGGMDAIRRYVSGVVYRQICSAKSTVFKKYRRPRMRTTFVPSFNGLEHLADPDRVVTRWRHSADPVELMPAGTHAAADASGE